MRCKTPRKGPRRPPRRDTLDPELSELANVLAEHKLDNIAANWFKLPWRDGWNAIELTVRATPSQDDDGWLSSVCRHKSTDKEIYWTAQDRLASTVTPSRMMRAGLRCLQALLSHSDGGGEVYNAILLAPFAELYPSSVDDLVREYRCRDSIGTSTTMQNDHNDRLRRAFLTAWNRGLYLAAYSLPPAAIAGQLKVIK